MHNPDFLAFKESQTDIEFIVRNIDRKPINLTGRKLFATLVDYHSKQTMARIPLQIMDATRGIARLTLLPHMVKDMPLGTHRYSVSYMLDNGNVKLLNVDQYETSHAYFELRYGEELHGIQSQEALIETFSTQSAPFYNSFLVSPNFKGNLQNGSVDGLHTTAWYMSEFTGSVWVEGSLVESTPSEGDWFPVLIDDQFESRFENASGITAHNIEANLQWVRFKVQPAPQSIGKLTKILFRN